ncbi:hypothetical protein HMPREF0290_2967 [Corynebacterium efficiens YS-314]|nr:hypothetical protein HMPREF0290_2967 [Corynebacterium efficiens YS-314]
MQVLSFPHTELENSGPDLPQRRKRVFLMRLLTPVIQDDGKQKARTSSVPTLPINGRKIFVSSTA